MGAQIVLRKYGVHQVNDVEKWAKGQFPIKNLEGTAAKAACKTANNAIDTEIRTVLGASTAGISVGVNAATQAVTGLGGLFGVGPGRTDAVMEADKQIMKAIGCDKYM